MKSHIIQIRPLKANDIEECVRLYSETIHTINAKDYSQVQLDAWAPPAISHEDPRWQTLLKHISYVAQINDVIVGFSDLTQEGYLDRLFVHKNYQGKGIATLLVKQLEKEALVIKLKEIQTEASITAKPFFEHMGYHVQKAQQKDVRGVILSNFVMKKNISGSS